MKSLSRVGVGLSVIFGCLLLALFAELYYLLWWKKKKKKQIIIATNTSSTFEQGRPNPSSGISDVDSKSLCEPQQQGDNLNNLLCLDKEFQFKPPEQDRAAAEGLGPEAELHKIPSPPRLLFTIVEETNEDLESDDGKSGGAKVKRSLSDYLATVESQTPYMTPITSPSLFTPSVTPDGSGTGTGKHRPNRGVGSGFDPCSFESSWDAEFNRKRCSPPPTFKFLQDAEEKLRRKLVESEQVQKINGDQTLPLSMRLADAAEQLITISISKSIGGGGRSLMFDFFGDTMVSYFLTAGMTAAFGATKDLKAAFERSGSNIDKFFDKGYTATGLILFSFISTALFSVISSFSIPKNI